MTRVSGWQFSGIATMRSGEPFSVYSGVDNSMSGVGSDRADLIADPYISGSRSRGDEVAEYLNPAAFTVNPLGTFGNTGRNMFYGPGFASLDLSLEKTFHPAERFGIVFCAGAFNALNRPNLENPNNTLGPNFMVINSAFDPRILQFALRVNRLLVLGEGAVGPQSVWKLKPFRRSVIHGGLGPRPGFQIRFTAPPRRGSSFSNTTQDQGRKVKISKRARTPSEDP
jgi:hypothetical protein